MAQIQIRELGVLPENLLESSGLLNLNNQIYSFNDSGNTTVLYELDTVDVSIKNEVGLTGIETKDWEAITADEATVYLADIGNNKGARKDLVIYTVPRQQILDNTVSSFGEIIFSYPDQTDFSGSENSDFDAEAILASTNQLYIFTKQWQSNQTRIYSLPKTAGSYIAQNIGTIQIDGLVTDATWQPDANAIAVVGYSNTLQPFFALIPFNAEAIDGVTIKKYDLPIGLAQVEGITAIGQNQFLISCEKFTNPPFIESPARLFLLKIPENETDTGSTNSDTDNNNDENNEEEDIPNPDSEDVPLDVLLYLEKESDFLSFKFTDETSILGAKIFDVTGKQILSFTPQQILDKQFNISTLSSSIYHISFFTNGRTLVKPFYKTQ